MRVIPSVFSVSANCQGVAWTTTGNPPPPMKTLVFGRAAVPPDSPAVRASQRQHAEAATALRKTLMLRD
jgi:hypothetical protein